MGKLFDDDVSHARHIGQIQALFQAVVVLIDLQPNPAEFAAKYRDRLAGLSKLSHLPLPLNDPHARLAVSEMSDVLLEHAVNRGTP